MENELDVITKYLEDSSKVDKKIQKEPNWVQVPEIPENAVMSKDLKIFFYSSTNSPIKMNRTGPILKKSNNSYDKPWWPKVFPRNRISSTSSMETPKKQVTFALDALAVVAERDSKLKDLKMDLSMPHGMIVETYMSVCDRQEIVPSEVIYDICQSLTSSLVLKNVDLCHLKDFTVLCGILFYKIHLKYVEIEQCKITDQQLIMLASALQASGTVRSIIVANNSMLSDSSLQRVLRIVGNVPSLAHLSIEGLSFKEKRSSSCLANQLTKQLEVDIMGGLQSLRLENVSIRSPVQIQVLAIGIRNSKVKYLSLRSNGMDEYTVLGLTYLFPNCHLSAKERSQLFKLVCKLASQPLSLQLFEKKALKTDLILNEHSAGDNELWVLDLSRNKLKSGVALLAEAAKRSQLKHLNLSKNGIEHKVGTTVFESLEWMSHLEILDMSHNTISDKEEDMSQLRSTTNTKKANERDNQSILIAKCLMKSQLKCLYLAYCRLHYNTLLDWSDYVSHFPCLRSLDLRGNIFRMDALKAFSASLVKNSLLTRVEVSPATIRTNSQEKLQEILMKIMSLCALNLETQLRQVDGLSMVQKNIDFVFSECDDVYNVLSSAMETRIDSVKRHKAFLKSIDSCKKRIKRVLKLLDIVPSVVTIEKMQFRLFVARDSCNRMIKDINEMMHQSYEYHCIRTKEADVVMDWTASTVYVLEKTMAISYQSDLESQQALEEGEVFRRSLDRHSS